MKYGILSALLAMTTVLCAVPASAQRSRADARILAEHPFIPSTLVGLPFSTRDYDMHIDLGAAYFKFQGLSNDEKAVLAQQGIDEEMVFGMFQLAFTTQQPIWKGIALRANLRGFALSGATPGAILGQGADFGFEVGGGPSFQILQTNRVAIGTGLDVNYGRGYRVTPGPVLEEAAEKINQAAATGQPPLSGLNQVSTAKLLERTSSLYVRPRLGMAVGFASWVGMHTELMYAFSDSEGQRSGRGTSHSVQYGLGMSFNFDALGAYLPLGLNLAYRLEKELTGNKDLFHRYEFGIHYASTKHFILGLALEGSVGTVAL